MDLKQLGAKAHRGGPRAYIVIGKGTSMLEPEETRKEPYLVETWHPESARSDLAVKPELRNQEVRVQEVRVQEVRVQEVRVQDVRVQENRENRVRTAGSPLP